MTNIVSGLSASFPQTSTGRTREQLTIDVLDTTGGGDRPEAITKAGRAIDSAVREYNSVAWKFNRLVQDITLVSGTQDYTLSSNFKTAFSAAMIDSNGDRRILIGWIPFEQWIRYYTDQSATSAIPRFYTIRNKHEVGLLSVDPIPATTITYPTLRVHYNRRIVLGQVSTDVLNVPEEVEEGIKQLAEANILSKTRDLQQWVRQKAFSLGLRIDLEAEHRDWPDREFF